MSESLLQASRKHPVEDTAVDKWIEQRSNEAEQATKSAVNSEPQDKQASTPASAAPVENI